MREAVKALEAMRVLDVRRGDGTYVTSLEPHLLLEAMSFVLDFHASRAVLGVFEVRRMIEPAAAALAALRRDEVQAERMQAHLALVDERTASDVLVPHDTALHRMIAEATGNAYLVSVLETMSDRTARARVWRGLTQEHAVERTLLEHARIVDAIAAGDAELARAAMTVHIAGVERWLLDAAARDVSAALR